MPPSHKPLLSLLSPPLRILPPPFPKLFWYLQALLRPGPDTVLCQLPFLCVLGTFRPAALNWLSQLFLQLAVVLRLGVVHSLAQHLLRGHVVRYWARPVRRKGYHCQVCWTVVPPSETQHACVCTALRLHVNRGLEAVKKCQTIYLEAYTSLLLVQKEKLVPTDRCRNKAAY